jgi:hypothetical protein
MTAPRDHFHCAECDIDLTEEEISAGARLCYGCVEWYATQPNDDED